MSAPTPLPIAGPRAVAAWAGTALRRRPAATAAAAAASAGAALAAVAPAWVFGVLVDQVAAGAGTTALLPVAAVLAAAFALVKGMLLLPARLLGQR